MYVGTSGTQLCPLKVLLRTLLNLETKPSQRPTVHTRCWMWSDLPILQQHSGTLL